MAAGTLATTNGLRVAVLADMPGNGGRGRETAPHAAVEGAEGEDWAAATAVEMAGMAAEEEMDMADLEAEMVPMAACLLIEAKMEDIERPKD